MLVIHISGRRVVRRETIAGVRGDNLTQRVGFVFDDGAPDGDVVLKTRVGGSVARTVLSAGADGAYVWDVPGSALTEAGALPCQIAVEKPVEGETAVWQTEAFSLRVPDCITMA